MMSRCILTALAAATLMLAAGCKTKKIVHPEVNPGWHDASFSVVFGRLQRIPAQKAGEPPVWVVRFGPPNDIYGGQLAITPPERIAGFSGGEQVEVRGRLRPGNEGPLTWYEASSIKLWRNYR
jgi:hypothetical protein